MRVEETREPDAVVRDFLEDGEAAAGCCGLLLDWKDERVSKSAAAGGGCYQWRQWLVVMAGNNRFWSLWDAISSLGREELSNSGKGYRR